MRKLPAWSTSTPRSRAHSLTPLINLPDKASTLGVHVQDPAHVQT